MNNNKTYIINNYADFVTAIKSKEIFIIDKKVDKKKIIKLYETKNFNNMVRAIKYYMKTMKAGLLNSKKACEQIVMDAGMIKIYDNNNIFSHMEYTPDIEKT